MRYARIALATAALLAALPGCTAKSLGAHPDAAARSPARRSGTFPPAPIFVAASDTAAVLAKESAAPEGAKASAKELASMKADSAASDTTKVATVTPSPGPELTVGLDATKKADLTAQARADLDAAEARIRTLRRQPLGPQKSERVRTVESMIAAAREALADDPTAAANLAHKARLLAEEISSG